MKIFVHRDQKRGQDEQTTSMVLIFSRNVKSYHPRGGYVGVAIAHHICYAYPTTLIPIAKSRPPR